MTDDDCSTNLAIILVMMQLAKKVPFEDPQVLMLVRGCYILSNILILAVSLYTQFQINKKKGMSTDRVLQCACSTPQLTRPQI
jgi:hypothetical protein